MTTTKKSPSRIFPILTSVALVAFVALSLLNPLLNTVFTVLMKSSLPYVLFALIGLIFVAIACAAAIFAIASIFVKKINSITTALIAFASFPLIYTFLSYLYNLISNLILSRFGTDMINSAFNQIFKVALYLVALVIALIFALAVGILSTKVLKSKRKIVALISSIVIAIVAIIASLMCIIIIISAFSLLRYIFGGYFETTYVIALIYSYFASPLINIGMCLTLVASAVLAFLMIPSSKGDKDSAPTATEAPKAEEKSEAAPVAREEMAAPATVEGGSNQNDVFDVIMKYKKLYEAGAITEEEFLSKKKQLMGL